MTADLNLTALAYNHADLAEELALQAHAEPGCTICALEDELEAYQDQSLYDDCIGHLLDWNETLRCAHMSVYRHRQAGFLDRLWLQHDGYRENFLPSDFALIEFWDRRDAAENGTNSSKPLTNYILCRLWIGSLIER